MKNTPRPQAQASKPKSIGRFLFRKAFSFPVGEMIQPLFDSTRVFVHLIAETFAIYKLLPKDYPGLQDPNAKLSLFNVIATAWKNVRFTRDGAIQALLFFTVVGIMIISTLVVISGLFSLFTGTAHAAAIQGCTTQTAGSGGGGPFAPETCDAAQMWLSFLFEGKDLTLFGASGASATWGLQDAIQGALGFYSDAILIIASLILLYHLVTMVLQTAHKGVAMGDQAKQIWAPIRLVMAIGLLVPIAGNLNSGQYIAIKTAELGSGLASRTWDVFLTQMLSTSPSKIPQVTSPIVADVGYKIIKMYACALDWNARVEMKAKYVPTLSESLIKIDNGTLLPPSKVVTENGAVGTKYAFSVNTLTGQDACGSFFVPSVPENADALTTSVYNAEWQALQSALPFFYDAGYAILRFASPVEAVGGSNDITLPVDINSKVIEAVNTYQNAVIQSLSGVFTSAKPADVAQDDVILSMQQYGWAFAGAFLSTVERLQGMVSSIFSSGIPTAQEPSITQTSVQNLIDGNLAFFNSSIGTRGAVITDYNSFVAAMKISSSSGTTTASPSNDTLRKIQCASMLGATGTTQNAPTDFISGGLGFLGNLLSGITDWTIDVVLMAVDSIATWNGVWKAGAGEDCADNSPGAGRKTFKLSVTFTDGAEVVQEIVKFGRANLDTGLRLSAWGFMSLVIGVVSSPLTGWAGPVIGAALLAICELLAMVFLALGAIFCFLLPLVAFVRFFFAVLIWVGEVIESIIAIPVVALAHLNPEGEGFLSAQAKRAYEFLFSIFLRPVMTVFGLIAGLMLFIIAANFMNYAYGIAVAATGAMAFNHEILTRIVFTIIYVFTLFMAANMCFGLITDFPNGAVSWMAAQKSQTPKIEGSISTLQQGETLATGLAIDKGVGAVSAAGKGIAEKAGGATTGGAPPSSPVS